MRIRINQPHWLRPIVEDVESVSINADVQYGTNSVVVSLPGENGRSNQVTFDLHETTIEVLPGVSAECYLGHADCYDRHEAARLSDEADWEEERARSLGSECQFCNRRPATHRASATAASDAFVCCTECVPGVLSENESRTVTPLR